MQRTRSTGSTGAEVVDAVAVKSLVGQELLESWKGCRSPPLCLLARGLTPQSWTSPLCACRA